jgi:hypothetical protein
MLRLTIEGNEIELYENEPINLSYQFSNLQEINASASSFSQTFRVPLTKKNQEYFGAVNEFGLITTWDPKTKASAELTSSTIPIMRGFIQVKGVYVQKGKYADVEIVFFGETANLSRDIGDGMLSDLDYNLDHALTDTNIINSWAGTLESGHVRYGVVDRGQNWSGTSTFVNPQLLRSDVTPFYRVSKVFNTIMTEAGYTYDSNFFNAQTGFESIDDLYLLGNPGGQTTVVNEFTESQLFHVGLSTNLSITGNVFTVIPFVESGNFYDPSNHVASGVFTAPNDGLYTFQSQFSLVTASSNHTLKLAFFKNGVEQQTIVDAALSSWVPGFGVTAFLSIFLNATDTVDIRYKFSTASDTATLLGSGSLTLPTCSFELYNVEFAAGEVVAEQNMPEIKQIDFVSGLQKMFNLVFIPDRNNSKHLSIEPFNEYMASGASKDWTNKIDLSKDIQIQPTTDLQARRYDWTHSQGKDLLNEAVFKSTSRVYGRYRVDDPGNDFASGNKEIKSPFAPHVVSRIPQTGYLVHRMLLNTTEEDKSLKKPLPRLAYWNGLVDGDLFYQNDTNTGAISATQYPVFSQYSVLNATVSNDDLGYGAERPFHIIQANPLNTLYYKYWRPFVNELYSSDARKLTAFFRLTRSELATFEFSDKIYIKDTYWRILSISYDATSEDLVKVEMLKVLGDIRDCTWLPISIDKSNGQIRFENAAGTQVYQLSPNFSSCCTKYGYIYDETNQRCYQPFEQ